MTPLHASVLYTHSQSERAATSGLNRVFDYVCLEIFAHQRRSNWWEVNEGEGKQATEEARNDGRRR
jgi:hypothetical protein